MTPQLIIIIVLCLLLAGLAAFGGYLLYQRHRSKTANWYLVQGRITAVRPGRFGTERYSVLYSDPINRKNTVTNTTAMPAGKFTTGKTGTFHLMVYKNGQGKTIRKLYPPNAKASVTKIMQKGAMPHAQHK